MFIKKRISHKYRQRPAKRPTLGDILFFIHKGNCDIKPCNTSNDIPKSRYLLIDSLVPINNPYAE